MPGAERSAGPVGQSDLAILDLTWTTFAPQLFDRFDDEKHPAHPWMIRRKAATIGVDREIAVETQASAADESAALTALAEAQVLEGCKDGDRKRVVDHRHIDVFMGDARALEGQASGLCSRNFEKSRWPRAAWRTVSPARRI